MEKKRSVRLLTHPWLVVILLFLVCAPAFSSARAARAGERATISFADLGYDKDETYQGIHVRRTYRVRWPDRWEAQPGNLLTIQLSHSKALAGYSSMAVDWNGARLGSVLLDEDNAERGSYTLEIPQALIESGYNQLEIEFSLEIPGEARCIDADNTALWATIHSTSFFDFNYELQSAQTDLGKLPLPFIDNSQLVTNRVTFVLPEAPSVAELNAMAAVSAKLGQQAGYRSLIIDISPESVATNTSGGLIFIGLANRLDILRQSTALPFIAQGENEVTLTGPENQVLADSDGLLWLQASPVENSAGMLIITAGSDEGLLKAARAVANSGLYPLLNGQLGVVKNAPEPDPDSSSYPELSFEELGYQDSTALGLRTQSLDIVIPMELTWRSQKGVLLDLHLAHSELLDQGSASLSVALNGSLVANMALNARNSQDYWQNFLLPARLFRDGDNTLTLSANLQLLPGDEQAGRCANAYSGEAWFVAYSDSRLRLPVVSMQADLTLAEYLAGYLSTGDLSGVSFIVPETPDLVSALGVARIAARLGRYANRELVYARVTSATSALAGSETKAHQILVGQPDRNPAISALNELLPLAFDGNSGQPVMARDMAEVLPVSGSTGYLQVARSEQGYARLVVTGNDEQGLQWATAAASEPALIAMLDGDLAIIQNPISIASLRVRLPEALSFQNGLDETQGEMPLQAVGWVFWLAGGFVLIAIVLLLVWGAKELQRLREVRRSDE